MWNGWGYDTIRMDFWGAIILFLIISFIFYKKGTKRSEKSLNQLEADEQFRNSSKFPY